MAHGNFEDILKRPSGEIKAPPPLPVGTYHCMVVGPPAAEESSQKKTPCRTYTLKILAPGPDVDQQQLATIEGGVIGRELKGQGVGTAFWITEDAAHIYKSWLTDTLGIDDGGGTKNLMELEAEAPGKQLMAKIAHQLSPDGKRIFIKIVDYARA